MDAVIALAERIPRRVRGLLLGLIGLIILTGADKQIESALVEWSPAWLTALTTRI